MTAAEQRSVALADRLLARIDRDALATIAARYPAWTDSGPDPSKYLDADRWIRVSARRAVALDLDANPQLRILDLGTGAGYFPLVCRELGHIVLATDWSRRSRVFRDLTAMLGVEVTDLDVHPGQSLGVDVPCDLITSYMVTFNGHGIAPWGVTEWRFFLDDAMARLAPRGRLVLELNSESDGRCYPPDLEALFLARGAVITGHWPHVPTSGGHRLVFGAP